MNRLNPAVYEAQLEKERVRKILENRKQEVDGFYKKLKKSERSPSQQACEEILVVLAGDLVEGAGTEEIIRHLRSQGCKYGREAYTIALRQLEGEKKIRRLGRKGLWLLA